MMIDFHTHAWPDRIAAHAMQTLIGKTACATEREGTLASLVAQCEEDDVKAVLLAIATNAHQMHAVNDWAAEAQKSDTVIASFGSVHPDAPDALEELDRIAALGMKGVKLHPEYQGVAPDDPRMLAIYKRISQLGLITVFHAGMDPAFMPPCRVNAAMLKKVLPYFDGTPVVAAHMGGYLIWEDILRERWPDNLYIDTSACYNRILLPLAVKLTEKFGSERILFGSDSPWTRSSNAAKLVEALPLTDAEKHRIYRENAERLLRTGA